MPAVSVEASRILVQKFGGTSVAREEQRKAALSRVQEARQRGFLPVVVVSAMGRAGEPYATDTLLSRVGGYSGARAIRDGGLLMSCGELISVVVMAHELRQAGLPARAMTGFQAGILTDGNFGEALVREVDTDRILKVLEAGQIPVIAGFQGITEDGDVTTLGRGGSDTTAVALGAALQGAGVVIYTDVDGILTGDPKLYPQARTVAEVTYEEAGELSVEGAKVLHPRCVDLAAQHKIPLWVRKTMMQGGGTRVSAELPKDALEKSRVVTSVVAVPGVTQVQVLEQDADLRVKMFANLAEAGVSLDVINVTPATVYFIVRSGQRADAIKVLERLGVLHLALAGCAKISIVGVGMRGTPGVMARIQKAMAEHHIQVLHSTDSNITISLLVREERVGDAVTALHKEFGLHG